MKRTILFFATLLLLMSSCKDSLKQALKPDASGTPYDLYVVMDEALKQTDLNDTIHAIFEFPMEGTPNGDPYFRVRHLTPENFSSQVIRIVANVAIVDIDAQNASEPVITLDRDRYATDQVIVKMHAQSIESLASYLSQVQTQLREVFVKNEIRRHVRILKEEYQHRQQDRLIRLQEAMLNLPIAMDVTCKPAVDSTFYWVSDGFQNKQSWVVAYSVPYNDPKIFSLEGAVAIRDSIMGANITGSDSTQYMETNQYIVLPEYKVISEQPYVGELRGMWRMHGGMMAGPFICHLRLDEVNKRVVFVEGFCYAPNDGKRLLIRNLESVLYTLKLPSDNLLTEVEVTLE